MQAIDGCRPCSLRSCPFSIARSKPGTLEAVDAHFLSKILQPQVFLNRSELLQLQSQGWNVINSEQTAKVTHIASTFPYNCMIFRGNYLEVTKLSRQCWAIFATQDLFAFAGHARVHWRLRQLWLLCNVVVGSGPKNRCREVCRNIAFGTFCAFDSKFAGSEPPLEWRCCHPSHRHTIQLHVVCIQCIRCTVQVHERFCFFVFFAPASPWSFGNIPPVYHLVTSDRSWVSLGPLWAIWRRKKHIGEAIAEPLGLHCRSWCSR